MTSLLDYPWVLGAGWCVAGMLLGYWLWRWKERNVRAALAIKEQAILETARRQADNIAREARVQANEEVIKLREQTEQTFRLRLEQITENEARLVERERLINHQLEHMVEEEKGLREQRQECKKSLKALESQHAELDEMLRQRREQLHALSHLSEPEARALMLKEVEAETLQDAATLTHRILDDALARAEDKARRIIGIAIQRYAGEHTFETTSATITLPDEELKGRIIGREGRNIRAFEAATGMTVLIDDTPNAVVLSGFDPVRRAIARESMQRLILDGRIHPTRIEEVVTKVSQEIEETVLRTGEEAVLKVGIAALHPELVKLLGRLRFRHSFSQNNLEHSIEVAHLAGMLAAELGLDVATAKRAGLLHDIGKAASHEIEGAHAAVGAELLRRYGESQEVVTAVASHHEETPHHSPISLMISAADAISASRPGARSETMATYIKRVEDLEKIGNSFTGVEKCYAVQAGRELRVMVQPTNVNDEQAYLLARNISRKIEEQLQYPGQIRVTVIRETRCIEFAK